MNETRPLLATTWSELKRRHVGRVAVAYVIVAWVALQVAEVVLEPLGAPAWAMTWAVLAAILGLPIALVLAWYFDATPQGIRTEPDTRTGAARLFVVGVTVLTVAGVGWWLAQVYEPRDATGTAAPADRQAASEPAAPPNSVAVLPFDDMSANRDQAWLADGIAEELLDRLARIEGLRVAARTSSFAFRGRADDVREIGRALGVALVLEGSVRKAGGRIRVTAQLIDAANGYHLWSETYERGDEDIFALQDEVTSAIATQLEQRIGSLELERATAGSGEGDPRALELYLEARQHWRRRTPAALDRARMLFEQALAIDPDFARANAGLADTYLLQIDYGLLAPAEAAQLAERHAVRAVSLDPRSAEAWATLGLLRMSVGQLDAAETALERAIELDPRYEMAPMWLAAVHGRRGRFDEQRRVLEETRELNPLEPVVNANLATSLADAGRQEEALEVLAQVLAVTPDDDLLLRTLAAVEAQGGRLDRALVAARRAHAVDATAPANIASYGGLLLRVEDFERAAAVFAPLPAESRVGAEGRQLIRLARGERGVDPGLEALAERLAAQPVGNGDDRELLTLAGTARLADGDARGAAPWLAAAAGGAPEALGDDPSALDPASLLVVALETLGEREDASAWRAAMEAAVQRWIAAVGEVPRVGTARAMLAAMAGDREAAIAAIEAAVERGFRERWRLLRDPRLASVRDDPRVRAAHARIGETLAAARAAAD